MYDYRLRVAANHENDNHNIAIISVIVLRSPAGFDKIVSRRIRNGEISMEIRTKKEKKKHRQYNYRPGISSSGTLHIITINVTTRTTE